MLNVSCVVDTSRLNAQVAEGIRFSRRSPAQNVNSAALAVVNRAIDLTPFVPVQRIDTELGTAVVLQRKSRGSGFRTAKRTQVLMGGKRGDIVTTVPLTVLIVRARQRPDSNYNRRTNRRYLLPSTAFRGPGGRAAMAAYINRMIKSRHSSTKFLIAGWVAARAGLRARAYSGEPIIDVESSVSVETDKGRSMPAREGGFTTMCVIENLIGLGQSVNAQNYNRALLEHGTRPLQRAIDEVAEDKMRHIWEKQLAGDLLPRWEAAGR
jgi:hypothetical protein